MELALNNQQWLIYHKTELNQTKYCHFLDKIDIIRYYLWPNSTAVKLQLRRYLNTTVIKTKIAHIF